MNDKIASVSFLRGVPADEAMEHEQPAPGGNLEDGDDARHAFLPGHDCGGLYRAAPVGVQRRAAHQER